MWAGTLHQAPGVVLRSASETLSPAIKQLIELEAAQTAHFFPNPALVAFLAALWPVSPSQSHKPGQEVDKGTRLSIPQTPLSQGTPIWGSPDTQEKVLVYVKIQGGK